MTKKHKKMKIGLMMKTAWVLPIFLAFFAAATIGVNAYLKRVALVENVFIAEQSETPSLQADSSVNVGETEYAVYVRGAIIVTWINSEGMIHANTPMLGQDYRLVTNTSDWFEKGGFYYYKSPVNSKEETEPLILSCEPLKAAPAEGYRLKVETVVQTIQAAGMTDETSTLGAVPAVTAQWEVTVDANMQLVK